MQATLLTSAFRYGAIEYDVADLVLVGWLNGEWPRFEDAVARGLTLDDAFGASMPVDEVEALVIAFRRERRLLAASEMRAWLSARSLRLVDVSAALRRRALREQLQQHVDDTPGVDPSRLAGVLWSDSICTGTLAVYADELRRWHAAADGIGDTMVDPPTVGADVLEAAMSDTAAGLPGLGAPELRRRLDRLAALQASNARFCASAVGDDDVDDRLAVRRLDWTVVTGPAVSFDGEGPARELLLRVTHDGDAFLRVAAELGLSPAERDVELGALPAATSAALLAAREGELVGPWREDGRWHLLEVDSRVEPDDPAAGAMRWRAHDELVREHLERVAAGKGSVLAPL